MTRLSGCRRAVAWNASNSNRIRKCSEAEGNGLIYALQGRFGAKEPDSP